MASSSTTVAKPRTGHEPVRLLASLLMAAGLFFAVLSSVGIALGSGPMGVVGLLFGAYLFYAGFASKRMSQGAELLNQSFAKITRGELAEADALLDRAEATIRIGYLRRTLDLQRALVAFRRGTLEPAIARSDAAIARPLGVWGRELGRVLIAQAHALRALLRAMSGHADGARADIAFVRASDRAAPDSLARAELAEAVLLERAGDRDALRSHLARERELLLSHTQPRERAIVRAYRRMLATAASTVYRQAAPRDGERSADEPTVADWMATVVPAAAPFASTSRTLERSAVGAKEPEVVAPEALKTARARNKGVARWRVGRLLLIWVACTTVFLAIWQFLAPEPPPPSAHRAPQPTVDAAEGADFSPFAGATTILVSLALGAAVIVAVRAHARSHTRRLFAAAAAVARGRRDEGEAELRALTKSRYPIIAADASFQLARLAERRADFSSAREAIDQGFAAAQRTAASRTIAASILSPSLIAERAFTLAATGRDADAAAEMAVLADTYSLFPLRALAELRVGLMRSVQRGDLAGAAQLAGHGIDGVSLNPREEALADMVRAVADPESLGAAEVDRIKREVHLDVELRQWLEAVAPAALAALSSPMRVGDADQHAEAEANADAEAHIEAEAEAHAQDSHGVRRLTT